MKLLDLLNATPEKKIEAQTTIQDMPYGEIVIHTEILYPKYLFMRLKPVNYLLNSTIINDVINRRDSIVCRIDTGTCYCMKGDTLVHIASKEEIANVTKKNKG